jgi:hypothetical protein
MNIVGHPGVPPTVPGSQELDGSHDWYIQRSVFGVWRNVS